MRIFLSPVDTELVMGSGGPLFFIKSFSKGIPICLRFHPGILIAEVCHKDVRKRSSLRQEQSRAADHSSHNFINVQQLKNILANIGKGTK